MPVLDCDVSAGCLYTMHVQTTHSRLACYGMAFVTCLSVVPGFSYILCFGGRLSPGTAGNGCWHLKREERNLP